MVDSTINQLQLNQPGYQLAWLIQLQLNQHGLTYAFWLIQLWLNVWLIQLLNNSS